MEKIKDFFSGVKKEIGRVRWPNKEYMFKYSLAVIIFGACLSLFFYLMDVAIAAIKVWMR